MTDPNYDPLAENMFSFRVNKEEKVFISWYQKQVKILQGAAAQKFLRNVATLNERETQLLMAKLTGNFKRGNERLASDKNKRT